MGQYYHPINIKSKEWIYSHDYDSGLKLMEHSWLGNDFVGVVMQLMVKGGKWHKQPIVWCGDYYGEPGENKSYNKMVAKEDKKIKPTKAMDEATQKTAILVNHTKQMYAKFYPVSDEKTKERVIDRLEGKQEWTVNILPLLTALGNGRGGGDYRGINEEMVGVWAEDILSVEFEVPKGFEEFKIEFKED